MLSVSISRAQGDFSLDMRFDAPEGATALFGRSGAGKTSLANTIAGLEKPDAGRIAIKDRVLFDAATGLNLSPAARRVGYVFQNARLFPHLSVAGNLAYGRRAF